MNDQTPIDDLQPDIVPDTLGAEPARPDWTEDDAAEARAFGWKAPEEWAGEKPAGYIDDPRRYMDRAQSFKPFKVLREQAENDKRAFEERIKRMEAVTAKTVEAQRAAYERDMEAIRRQQLEAVDTADRERYDALEKQKTTLARPPELPAVPPEPSPVAREVDEYGKENTWVNNPILRDAGARLIDANGWANRPPREQLQLAEAEVRKLYPGAFPAATPTPAVARTTIQRVDGGGLGGGAKGGAFTALPGEAKTAFKRFVEQGIFTDTEADRKRYADDYNS